jgi:Icc-related predicted phosphoesterase
VHSPPKGHLDGDRHLGSESVLRTIEDRRPRVALCGHIHECAGQEATIASTRVLNLGPNGTAVDV